MDLSRCQIGYYDRAQGQPLSEAIYYLDPWARVLSSSQPYGGPGLGDKENLVERRSSCRHSLRIPVRLRVWGSPGPSQVAKSVDISEDGALLETDLPLRVGASLDLRIELPEEITGQPTTEWRFKSRVVRLAVAASAGHPLQAGVHFDRLHLSAR